jgi:hypothetical protein
MYFKSLREATSAAALLFATACSLALPWGHEPLGQEVNIAFTLENNLLFLPSATIDGRSGRFLFGSAQPQTVLDPKFAHASNGRAHSLQFNQHESLRFAPVIVDLHGIGDGIVGADVWSGHAVTINYRAGLLTYQKEGMHPDMMVVYNYADVPMINIIVNGRRIPAIVDTTSPDTLVLPRAGSPAQRRSVRVKIADIDFGDVNVQFGDVAAPRVGNRLLSRFLVSIDYGRRQVGLWRDPRTAL